MNAVDRENGTSSQFNIAYSGKATNKKITADAINEFGGETFSITGKKVKECPVVRRLTGRNPWGIGF